jgi:hypothetical protein
MQLTATTAAVPFRRAPLGLRRPPWLTIGVFVLTAAMSVAQLAVPSLLGRLERTPRRRQERREPVLRPAALAVVATGLLLTVAANIHGAALLAGTGLGALTARAP